MCRLWSAKVRLCEEEGWEAVQPGEGEGDIMGRFR